MTPERIRNLLDAVSTGTISVDKAMEELRLLPFEDLGFAKVDHHRALRRGFPEVIFGPGKTPEQIRAIATRLSRQAVNVLVTKTTRQAFDELRVEFPTATWHETAKAIAIEASATPKTEAKVAIVSAGTADLPIAEEAALTATLSGVPVERVYDVGVAGLHRLTAHRDVLSSARVLIVVAGMEGALPSVVAGLVGSIVIAVPTSVGYGASFGGLAALLGMLTSCAPGIAVVNIDNGFGAGYLAALFLTSC